MNITLSAQDELIEKARQYAREHDTSLNQLIRDYLERLVGAVSLDEAADQFAVVARQMGGCSGDGAPAPGGWTGRDDLYAPRIEKVLRRLPREPSGGADG